MKDMPHAEKYAEGGVPGLISEEGHGGGGGRRGGECGVSHLVEGRACAEISKNGNWMRQKGFSLHHPNLIHSCEWVMTHNFESLLESILRREGQLIELIYQSLTIHPLIVPLHLLIRSSTPRSI